MSITGQTGHVAFAKQTAFGTPNVTAGNYKAVKITGDSLVASNNQIIAEGEIGSGRDVTQGVPGGFSSAGAVNGNLRARAASVLLEGALGTRAPVALTGTPPTGTVAFDDFDVADVLPTYTVEKKVGTTGAQLLTLRYTDVMINTLNISIPSGGLSTFSAGLIACGEQYIAAPLVTPTYLGTGDDLFVFHGGRIKLGDSADGGAETLVKTETFQSIEVVINNNVAADEFTVRPSRFLRSLTEGIRTVECNFTIIFEDFANYQKFTYGANARTAPGYNLYNGALEIFLGNWQIADISEFQGTEANLPANPQAMRINLHKVQFAGMPVTLSTGRIAVSTTGRALKPSTGNILDAAVRPQQATV